MANAEPDRVEPQARSYRRGSISTVGLLAVLAGVCGLLGLIGGLPSGVKLLLILVFVLVGPGCAVLSRFPAVEPPMVAALAPVIGLSIIAVVTGLAAIWHSLDASGNSTGILAVLAGLTIVAAGVAPSRVAARESHALDPDPVPADTV